MDILLADKAAEMVGLKSKFADTGNSGAGGAGKAVWAIISVFCLVFAMWHAYNANKCEKQGSKLILSLILSFLFPKIATLYYAMKYKTMPWGADKNADLLKRYHGASLNWDMDKCAKWVGTVASTMEHKMDLAGLSEIPTSRAIGRDTPTKALRGSFEAPFGGNMYGGWASDE